MGVVGGRGWVTRLERERKKESKAAYWAREREYEGQQSQLSAGGTRTSPPSGVPHASSTAIWCPPNVPSLVAVSVLHTAAVLSQLTEITRPAPAGRTRAITCALVIPSTAVCAATARRGCPSSRSQKMSWPEGPESRASGSRFGLHQNTSKCGSWARLAPESCPVCTVIWNTPRNPNL